LSGATGEPSKLTNDAKDIKGLAWTADGSEIVFASDRHGRFQLWRVVARTAEAAGSYPTPVLVEGAGDDASNPSISRTSKLAYQRYSPNIDIQQVEVIGEAGTGQHRLGRSKPLITSTQLDVAPVWSPDGRTIAFISNRSGTYEVWICGADGFNPLKLTSFGGTAVTLPRWSHDGQRLIFSALTGPDGNFESYIIDAKGGAPRRLRAASHRTIAFPVFSRNDRWIYFVPGARDGDVEVFRMPVEGGEEVRVTRNGALVVEESYDGKLLYYSKYARSGLWSIPVSGGEERQVLNSADDTNWTVTSDGIYFFDPAIPDAAPKPLKFLSFKTTRINVVGNLEMTAPYRAGMSVSPDGRRLLYCTLVNADSDLMLLDHFR
jgi:Tol biopolymer transport system component